MKKCYYLASCSTCIRILKEWKLDDSFTLQDIKTEKMTETQIDELIKLSGSAESLFSRRAMKYKSMSLGNQDLTESDYRRLIIDEYTFLKRPVLVVNDQIFIGNSKKTVEKAAEFINT